tara:strand:+ start:3464 stop:4552 length:1089 start_codon:yes stop_codon:yes gene_type:complete
MSQGTTSNPTKNLTDQSVGDVTKAPDMPNSGEEKDPEGPRIRVLDSEEFPTSSHEDLSDSDKSSPQGSTVIWTLITSRIETALAWARSHPIFSGAMLGALIALLVTYGVTQLFSKPNPQIIEIASVTDALVSKLSLNNQRLTGLEADVAQSITLATTNAESISQYDKQLKLVFDRLESAEQSALAQTTIGSPIFGVAAAQLLTRISTGESFAPEWVNVYSLAASNESLRQDLNRLMPIAQTGVRTTSQLLSSLITYRERTFFPESGFGRFWVQSLSSIQYKLGVPVARSPSEEVALQHIDQAISRLQSGDVAGAEYVISTLDRPFSDQLTTWLEATRRYQVALEVARNITAAAEVELRKRLK